MTTDAGPDIVRAYREQARLYREAMWMLLRGDAGQAAAFVALQAVRSAAFYALAVLTGRVTDDVDTVAVLWEAVPEVRLVAVLQSGADVLALHDDLTLYAYAVDCGEAHMVAEVADIFCTWALAVAPVATETDSAPVQSMNS
jgi:hypothetical protein